MYKVEGLELGLAGGALGLGWRVTTIQQKGPLRAEWKLRTECLVIGEGSAYAASSQVVKVGRSVNL